MSEEPLEAYLLSVLSAWVGVDAICFSFTVLSAFCARCATLVAIATVPLPEAAAS